MKHLHTLFTTVCLSAALFSCTKKVHTFQFGQPYYQNNPVKAELGKEQLPSIEVEPIMEVSSKEEITAINPEAIEVAKSIKEVSNIQPVNDKPAEKLTLKQKLTNKAAKKIQKQMGRSGLSGNLRIGIIVAAIGLLVVLIAGLGGFGGAGGVFWVLGLITLLVGLIIILLELV